MIAAGVALFEVALIPGMAIGAAAVLAPKYVPKLRRRLRPLLNSTDRRRIGPALAPPGRPNVKVPLVAPAGIAIKQAPAKTITFQIIVTTLDFTAHYVVLGNLASGSLDIRAEPDLLVSTARLVRPGHRRLESGPCREVIIPRVDARPALT
jgi:hypothetical protein